MASAMMLKVLPQELNCAIHLVGILLITPWMIIISIVNKKTW